jgi:hypothetical protein
LSDAKSSIFVWPLLLFGPFLEGAFAKTAENGSVVQQRGKMEGGNLQPSRAAFFAVADDFNLAGILQKRTQKMTLR